MDLLVALVLKVAGGLGGVALSVYLLYRLVLAARKMGRTGTGGEIVGVFVMLFGPTIAPPPPHEVAEESRELKRNEDDGDPPESTGGKVK
jgi:hypothetical protein